MSGTIIEEYTNFMRKHQIKSEVKFTLKPSSEKPQQFNFMSMGKPYGKYYIPPDDMNDFYTLYSRVVNTTETDLHLVERPGVLSPIKVDIDLSFAATGNKRVDTERRYTPKMVKKLISIYRQEIEKLFNTKVLGSKYRVYLFEKPKPTVREQDVKEGFHLMFSVISDAKTQQLLRKRVLPKINKIFGVLEPANNADHILDKAVVERGNWMVYGSCKPSLPGYKLTKAYTLKSGPVDKFYKIKLSKINRLKMPKMFRVSGYDRSTPYLNKDKEDEVLEWYTKERKISKRKERKELERIIDVLRAQNNKNVFVDNKVEPRERIEQLVRSLSPKRADNYTEWMEVGWCLNNLNPEYFDIWVEFSRQSSKFSYHECETRWERFEQRDDGLTVASLYYWVKTDNPDAYNEVRENDIFGLAIKHMTGTHYDLACLMYAMFKDKYVCADFSQRVWYKFDNHRWQYSTEGYEIRRTLSTELVNLYNRIIAYFENKSSDTGDGDHRKACGAVTLFSQQISFKLKNETFKARVMEACKQKFYEPKFLEKLDADPHLLGFENGIYDFRQKQFRPGKPEDFVSLSTGIRYIEYSKNHKMYRNVKRFFRQIMPIKCMRSYLKRLMSTFLSGYNAEQKFNIFIGVGSNGKSVLLNLIRSIMGDYFAKIDVALITRKRKDANSASPELAKIKGKRLCVFDEPNHNEPLNLGIMKILSGADAITARALYGEPIEFIPQCKLALLTNHLPIIQKGDNGVWRRISVTEFMSRFKDNPNENRKYEFQIDRTLNQQLKQWGEHVMAMLVHTYVHKYMEEGIKEPEEVVKYTKRYEEKSDHYKRFLNECTKKVKDRKKTIRLTTLYGELKLWYRSSFPSNKDCPSKADLGEYLMDNFEIDDYNPAKKRMYGYMVTDDDESDSEDELEENKN